MRKVLNVYTCIYTDIPTSMYSMSMCAVVIIEKNLAIPLKDSRGSVSSEKEPGAVCDSQIWFYYLWESWTRCWLADWAARRTARVDGANGIRMLRPHLSVVMVWWQVLMDRLSWRPVWQLRLADELWNETDIQKAVGSSDQDWPSYQLLSPPSHPPPLLLGQLLYAAQKTHHRAGNLFLPWAVT